MAGSIILLITRVSPRCVNWEGFWPSRRRRLGPIVPAKLVASDRNGMKSHLYAGFITAQYHPRCSMHTAIYTRLEGWYWDVSGWALIPLLSKKLKVNGDVGFVLSVLNIGPTRNRSSYPMS